MMVEVAEANPRNTAVFWALGTLQRSGSSEATAPPLTYPGRVIPVRREIEHIRSYVAIYRHRDRDRISATIRVDEEIMECRILNLTLQPFVENAIRHGLEPKVGSGVAEITGKRQGKRIVFVIEDDGVGIPPDAEVSDGFAVSNVRDRIDLHYGEAFGVKLTRRPEGGTRVRVELPFNPSESGTGGRKASSEQSSSTTSRTYLRASRPSSTGTNWTFGSRGQPRMGLRVFWSSRENDPTSS